MKETEVASVEAALGVSLPAHYRAVLLDYPADLLDVEYSSGGRKAELAVQVDLLRDIFGNPFQPVTFHPEWRTSNAVALARQMYESRDFNPIPILADALQDAGCDDELLLGHCRGPGPHVRGC